MYVFVRSFARLAHIQTKNVQVYERSLVVYVIIKYNIAPAAVENEHTHIYYTLIFIRNHRTRNTMNICAGYTALGVSDITRAAPPNR